MSGLQISAIILAVSLGIFNFFLFAAVGGTVTADKRRIAERLKKLFEGNNKYQAALSGLEKRRQRILKKATGLDGAKQSERSKKLMDTIFNELISADIMMRPEEFCIIWIVLTFVPSGLAALFKAGVMPAATLAGVGAFLPLMYIKIKKGKRLKVFESQLSDTLIMMCNSLKSGFSFQQAMEHVGAEMPAPIGMEFQRVCNEIQYGATLETALDNLVKRVKSPDLMLVVSAVCIQKTTGGNLSEILTTISDTIRERLKIKGEIQSITAQGRTSGMIIGALPVLITVALMVINPSYMNTFFTTKTGNIMLIVSVVMELIGFFAIRKVVSVEY